MQGWNKPYSYLKMSHVREKKKKGEYKEGGQKKTKENLNLREFKLEKIIFS